jgi:hypothetical protein
MSDEISLAELGIQWKGSPRLWHTMDKTILPYCNAKGEVHDSSGILFKLKPAKELGRGTFGQARRQ